MIEERALQLQHCMYQYSRAIYRSVKDMIDPYGDRESQVTSRRAVLEACEQTMERLASDPLYFAKPDRALFQDIRLSAVFGLALVINLFMAALAGSVVPLALERFGRDPAVSSSIFVQSICAMAFSISC